MKAMRVVARVFSWILTIVVVLLVAFVLALAVAQRRAPDGVPRVYGHIVLSVLSGSMTPVFVPGDGILDRTITPAQAERLKVGQVITFAVNHQFDGAPMLITHRIVGIMTIKSSQSHVATRLYVTKGDANNSPDSATVSPAQVVGVYEMRLPYLGYVSSFVRRPQGFVLLLVLPVLYLVGSIFVQLWRRIGEEERSARQPMASEGGDGSP